MKHNLQVKCPHLPNDGENVLVELGNGIITGAIYKAKYWKKSEDLRNSFIPIGVYIVEKCGIESCYIKTAFNSTIINWISKEDIID